MIPWLFLAVAVATAALAAFALVAWLRQGRLGVAGRLDEVLAAHGAARCLASTALLRRLAASGRQTAILAAVDALELPLLQALPDCPPSAKAGLADALEACARVTANRAAAKRLMALRNALLG